MKKMKQFFLLATCMFILLGATACGNQDNADNGADQSTTDNNGNDRNDGASSSDDNGASSNTDDRTMNDATEGDGILDDAVHDVTDGVDEVTDDVTDGIDKAADEMTDDGGTDNSATDKDTRQ